MSFKVCIFDYNYTFYSSKIVVGSFVAGANMIVFFNLQKNKWCIRKQKNTGQPNKNFIQDYS